MRHLPAAAALLVLALVPEQARAHGVELEVDRRGAEVRVRATHHGGHPLAGARWEALSPASSARPHAAGLTDGEGALAFVADAPGTWTVRIAEAGGHGGTVRVEVPAPPALEPGAGAPAVSSGEPVPPARRRPGALLRTAGGVAAIAAVFAVLLAVQRRRRAADRR